MKWNTPQSRISSSFITPTRVRSKSSIVSEDEHALTQQDTKVNCINHRREVAKYIVELDDSDEQKEPVCIKCANKLVGQGFTVKLRRDLPNPQNSYQSQQTSRQKVLNTILKDVYKYIPKLKCSIDLFARQRDQIQQGLKDKLIAIDDLNQVFQSICQQAKNKIIGLASKELERVDKQLAQTKVISSQLMMFREDIEPNMTEIKTLISDKQFKATTSGYLKRLEAVPSAIDKINTFKFKGISFRLHQLLDQLRMQIQNKDNQQRSKTAKAKPQAKNASSSKKSFVELFGEENQSIEL